MKLKAILFDLDGTLLPMDQDVFVGSYFKLLAKKLAPYGYDSEQLIRAIYKGTAAMVMNDGTMTNEERFWVTFDKIMQRDARKDEPVFAEFYENDEEYEESLKTRNSESYKKCYRKLPDGRYYYIDSHTKNSWDFYQSILTGFSMSVNNIEVGFYYSED